MENTSIYMDIALLERLETYCEKTGLTKTTAIERFVAKGLKEQEEQDKIQEN